MSRKTERSLKGLAAGLIGGLFASWVMNRFQAGMSKLQERMEKPAGEPGGDSGSRQQQESGSDEEAATVKLAVMVSEKVLQRTVPEEEKQTAGQIVHYAYGTLAGGAYGLLAEHFETPAAGLGALFGTALWAVSDEVGVPALGLSKPPAQYPIKIHFSALAAHLVYGVATEIVRRGLRGGALGD